MRLPSLICLLLLLVTQSFAQPGKGGQKYTREVLCAELFAAVRASPERATMRLEEALVINESCAADLVTTAIDAVNGDPALTRKLVAAAIEMAPSRSRAIQEAVRNHKSPAAERVEIRRAMLVETPQPQPQLLPGEEVRRAEVPDAVQPMPIVEVRRAVVPTAVETGKAVEVVVQKPATPYNLMNVPKAKPAR